MTHQPEIGGIVRVSGPAITGFLVLDSLLAGRLDSLGNALAHLLLPAVTLGLPVNLVGEAADEAAQQDNVVNDYRKLAAEIIAHGAKL